MNTLTGPMRSLPRGSAHRIVIAIGVVLASTIPVFAVNLALIAAVIAAVRRSTSWRWYLAIAALALIVMAIDTSPFGIGELRPSQGEPA